MQENIDSVMNDMFEDMSEKQKEESRSKFANMKGTWADALGELLHEEHKTSPVLCYLITFLIETLRTKNMLSNEDMDKMLVITSILGLKST